MLALSKGLTNVVKASLSGSIIGNLLFGLGCAILAASLKSDVVFFNKRAARINSSLVMLATCGLIIPAIFNLTTQKAVESISVEISALLLLLYLLSLFFSLVTHKGFYKSVKEDSMEALMDGGQTHPSETEVEERPKVSILSAVSRLAFFAILIALVSEVLTDALTPMSAQFGFSDIFTGVILLSLGGNGEKMDLNFTSYEVVSILMAVSVTRAFTYDGESHWLEGYMILSVYFILGLGFYHLSN